MRFWTALSYHLLRLFISGLFLFAAAEKINHPDAFLQTVLGYELVPVWCAPLVVVLVPYAELLAAGALLLRIWERGAWLALFGLNIVFMAALSSLLLRGIQVGCGCFGDMSLGGHTPGQALLRDALFLLAMLVAWWLQNRPES